MTVRMLPSIAQAVLDALEPSIVVLDDSGKIIGTNLHWREINRTNAGVGADYLTICDTASGTDSEGVSEMAVGIRAVIRGNLDNFSLEYPCHIDAEMHWFIARVTRFVYEDQVCIVVAHEDITGRKLLKDELRHQGAQKTKQADELVIANAELAFQSAENTKRADELVSAAESATLSKSAFLANMSHELRTPMNGVLGLLGLLKQTKLNERQLDYADKAEGAALYLLGILNGILDYSKVEAGKMMLDPEPFEVSKLVSDLETILSSNLRGKPLSLLFDVDPLIPPVAIGDASRINQVLINLGGNAIKFTERGEVRVCVRLKQLTASEVALTFEVSDTGIGLLPEQQGRIFESFAQADVSISRRFGGTGLGLSISQRLLELMGSQLQVRSEFSVGSTFYFDLILKLPSVTLRELTHVAPLKISYFANLKRLDGLRVLVAEDNLINQLVVKTMLEQDGAAVELVENGQLAVNALHFSPTGFDIVLMDVQMPIMDGLQATRHIRQQLKLTDLPIIAMTANVMAADYQACIDAGMNDHVGKPFKIESLVELMKGYK